MQKSFFLLISFLSAFQSIFAQQYKMDNWVYDNQIKSVQTIVNGIITSIPVLRLNSSDLLTLQFDDIGDLEDNEFYYRVLLCDKDWNPSPLDPIEYIDGFNEERLRDWQTSLGTRVNYTHYWFSFPNRDTRMKVSGNFLIHVFNRYEDETPIFTRRVIITENLIAGSNTWVRPTNTDDIRFKQQMNLTMVVKNLRLQNPQRDITLTIVQNGDWNESIKNIQCRNFRDGVFTYDNFGQLSFWGNNEYRFFDTRTIRGRGWGVKSIDQTQEITEVTLHPSMRRDQNVYSFNFDFNGNFFVDNVDDFNRIIFNEGTELASKNKLVDFRNNFAYFDNRDDVWQIKDKEIRSDYVNVLFTLKTPKMDDDVYIVGGFTDFNLNPAFKMKYDDVRGMYFGEAVLKQGYYNYFFATEGENGRPMLKYTEGTWQDSENEYKVIAYFREFGSRYDRVLGVQTFNSIEY